MRNKDFISIIVVLVFSFLILLSLVCANTYNINCQKQRIKTMSQRREGIDGASQLNPTKPKSPALSRMEGLQRESVYTPPTFVQTMLSERFQPEYEHKIEIPQTATPFLKQIKEHIPEEIDFIEHFQPEYNYDMNIPKTDSPYRGKAEEPKAEFIEHFQPEYNYDMNIPDTNNPFRKRVFEPEAEFIEHFQPEMNYEQHIPTTNSPYRGKIEEPKAEFIERLQPEFIMIPNNNSNSPYYGPITM